MTGELLVKLLGPLCAVVTTLSVLKNGSPRAWVLPTPTLLWLSFWAERSTGSLGSGVLFARLATLVLLFACWQQRRRLAQGATVAAGLAVAWVLLSGHSS